jgi:DNA-binding NarL/FixJ family response regulator
MQAPYTLALLEDDVAIRETLQEYLGAQPEFRCVAAVGSVEELLAHLAAGRPAPQLLLSDIGLPGRSGIEGLPLIRARLPEVQVLMLSVYADTARIFAALQAGAVGYLLKNTPLAHLKESLLQVAAGGSPMSPGVARQVVQAFQARALPLAAEAAASPPLEPLTVRELEVVRGIEEGLSYQFIADRLLVSLDTVRNHIRAVYRKLHVNSRSELMARTLQRQRG